MEHGVSLRSARRSFRAGHPAIQKSLHAGGAAEVASLRSMGLQRVPAGDPHGGLNTAGAGRVEVLIPHEPPVGAGFALVLAADVAMIALRECHETSFALPQRS